MTLLISCISASFFFFRFLWIFCVCYKNAVSFFLSSLLSSLPSSFHFFLCCMFSFSSSNTMLKRHGESLYSCIIPVLLESIQTFATKYDVKWRFWNMLFIQFLLHWDFYYKWTLSVSQMFSLFCVSCDSHINLFLYSVNVVNYIDWFFEL